jgi:hypothetical protein
MNQANAQIVIDRLGQGFAAMLYGSDGSLPDDNALIKIPMTWISAWSGGLSAEFDVFVDRSVLDEDDGQDEVYAAVTFALPGPGLSTYRTNEVQGYF